MCAARGNLGATHALSGSNSTPLLSPKCRAATSIPTGLPGDTERWSSSFEQEAINDQAILQSGVALRAMRG
jgi:hypothetical protein